MHIGFIGLGLMGRAMATRLLEHGHRILVWNRSPEPARALAARGAAVAVRVEEVLACPIVVSMLADDRALEAVWVDSGLAQRAPESCLHINMASVSLALGRKLAELHERHGSAYVSAPVFGRPEIAASGELDIVCAGSDAAIERCQPIFGALGKRCFRAGRAPHHANIVKIARNFVLATIIESLGEAFALVEKSGVEPACFLHIITGTSMSAPAVRNYGRLMLERPADPTFPLRLGLKDVELALAAALETAVPMPSAALIRDQHLAAIAHGYGDKDWSELGNWIAELAGIAREPKRA